MSKIDRFMNTVADWASVDVSVDEMADLIEKRAILNHTPKELESLEDIMRKTWVLAVGNGMRRRKYEFDDGKISIVMDFNPFLHTCATIQVWDNENKINYFLPKGRENAYRLQLEVLTRLARYKSGGKDVPVKRPRRHPLGLMIFFAVMVAFLALCVVHLLDSNDIDYIHEAYSCATGALQKELGEDYSVEFPNYDSKFVTKSTETVQQEGKTYHVYTVSSYFELSGESGESERYQYVMDIMFPEDYEGEYYYTLVSLE